MGAVDAAGERGSEVVPRRRRAGAPVDVAVLESGATLDPCSETVIHDGSVAECTAGAEGHAAAVPVGARAIIGT